MASEPKGMIQGMISDQQRATTGQANFARSAAGAAAGIGPTFSAGTEAATAADTLGRTACGTGRRPRLASGLSLRTITGASVLDKIVFLPRRAAMCAQNFPQDPRPGHADALIGKGLRIPPDRCGHARAQICILGHLPERCGQRADIAYMVDQSHNLKNKVEEMIQTATTAQELYAKAALIDFGRLAVLQERSALVDAEEIYRDAFSTDVRPLLREWRVTRGLPDHPLRAFRESGYTETQEKVRGEKNRAQTASYA